MLNLPTRSLLRSTHYEDDIKRVPPSQIQSDESARDVLHSPDMQLCLRLMMAGLKGSNVQPQSQAIGELRFIRPTITPPATAASVRS